MTDRELLELAAKASKLDIVNWVEAEVHSGFDVFDQETGEITYAWNPLEDDGDALRLTARLRIHIAYRKEDGDSGVVQAIAYGVQGDPDEGWTFTEGVEPDEFAATRRAIVCAAAEIGRLK